jgi:hypothetical protein
MADREKPIGILRTTAQRCGDAEVLSEQLNNSNAMEKGKKLISDDDLIMNAINQALQSQFQDPFRMI